MYETNRIAWPIVCTRTRKLPADRRQYDLGEMWLQLVSSLEIPLCHAGILAGH